MKSKKIYLNGQEFTVQHDFTEKYNQVIIYEYQEGKAVPIASGSTLKEACDNWIKSEYAIDNLVANMEIWVRENNIDIESIGSAVCLDRYIETLSEHELFAFLSYDSHHDYIDWSEVESE